MAVLKEILLWANRFVPSESGSILFDAPMGGGPGGKGDALSVRVQVCNLNPFDS